MEVEIKLHVADEVDGGPEAFFGRLAALPSLAGLPLGPGTAHALRDVYYDTPEGTLARAGAGLRLRVQDGARHVTLKIDRSRDGALSRREEFEEPLTQERLDRVLSHVCDQIGSGPFPLQAFAAGERCGPLVPILDVVTARLTRPIGSLALLVLDRVTYPGVAEERFFDIEVEAATGQTGDAVLRAVEAALYEAAGGLLRPAEANKLKRGLALKALR
ncbi:MAG: CYTH domain-containing protein [Bacillota bacterium]